MAADAWRHLDLITQPVFVAEMGADGALRYSAFNKAGCDLFRRSASQVLGKTPLEAFPDGPGFLLQEELLAAFRDGEMRSFELNLTDRDTPLLVDVDLVPNSLPDGTVTCVVGTVTNANCRQIIKSVQLGMTTIKSEMQEFIGLTAHSLNAPLRDVASITHALRDGFQDLGDGKLDLIDLLERVGDNTMHLIDDTLAFAQLSALGGPGLVEFSLVDLVNEICVVLAANGAALITCDDVTLRADRMLLQLVLRNLFESSLRNASHTKDLVVHFGVDPQEGAEVSLHYAAKSQALDQDMVEVLNGAKPSLADGFGVLGLRRLVHARGGRVQAEKTDEGVQVQFSLPGNMIEACLPVQTL